MLLKVNSRLQFFNRDIVLVSDRPGRWSGTVSGHAFKIEGGRAAGGTSREWFVECPDFWNGSINATSLVDGLRLLDNC